MHKRVLVVLFAMALMLGVIAGPSAAQPPPHDHVLVVPGTGERIYVGPPRCEVGDVLQRAFVEVHFNVHLGEPTDTGVLTISADFC